MFKSEIKVTMGFNHPNIVQLYDFRRRAESTLHRDGIGRRQEPSPVHLAVSPSSSSRFPVELAAYIIEQSACGLHYAHSFKDKITAQPLNIVHRDISPQNILISYEGNIKVIDFGIAKATVNSESTRVGTQRKTQLCSPEQN